METAIVILLVVIIGFLLWDRLRANGRWQEQSEALSRVVGEKVEGSVGVFGEVQKQLGELTKRTQDIEQVGKSLCQLQEALRSPKFRGGFGELGLEQLLSNCVPPDYYSLQHRFKNGATVDAVVRVGKRLVPVDSKFPFPLEDFERLVTVEPEEERSRLRRQFARTIKKHVDDVAKYILPDEDTFDFALMYIPAENIYYETVVRSSNPDDDIYSYCIQKRVFPVSPNLFYAYLQTVALGLRGLQVEKSAREILGQLERLHRELNGFQEDYDLLGRHITNAARKHTEAKDKLTKLSGRIELMGGGSTPESPQGEADEK